VLTGGTGVRLGGRDKAGLRVGGRTLLDRALSATQSAAQVVLVGEPVDTPRPVIWTREHPAGGGPAAGLLAGVDALDGPPALVAVLAVDMPGVTTGTFERLTGLLAADPAADGAVLVDAEGHRQTLAAVYRTVALLRARPAHRADEHGLSIRRLLAPLTLREVPAVAAEAADIDTAADLEAWGG
jgi:molybdopterin-guanine dinucleotide biosynthesis protein A